MQKTISHIGIGEILYTKRKACRTIKISVSVKNGVRVSLPYYTTYSDAAKFVDSNIEKILAIIKKQENKIKSYNPDKDFSNLSPEQLKEVRTKAHQILPQRTAQIAKQLSAQFTIRNMFGLVKSAPFSYNRIAIKNNKSNWGSCSAAKNINLNMHLVSLPQELMDYVIIHELCHLIYPNHGEKFHTLVNSACNGKENEYSKELKKYHL